MKSIPRKHDLFITFFTCILAITAIINVFILVNQNKISQNLYKIQKYYYEQEQKSIKLENILAHQEFQIIINKILNLFSVNGINERLKHRKYENLQLAADFRSLLVEGIDNIILIENKEALRKWYDSLNLLYIFSNISDRKLSLENMDDDTFNDIFIDQITSAWENIFWIYTNLDLTPNAIGEKIKTDLTNKIIW